MLAMRKSIYFTGGDFRLLQAIFDEDIDVMDSRVGYLNGLTAFPKHEDVLSGNSQHMLAVKVDYDAEVADVHEIIEVYVHALPYLDDQHKPCMAKGIYYDDFLDGVEALEVLIEHGYKEHEINIAKTCNFFIAALEHQHYYKSHPEELSLNLDEILKDKRKSNA